MIFFFFWKFVREKRDEVGVFFSLCFEFHFLNENNEKKMSESISYTSDPFCGQHAK